MTIDDYSAKTSEAWEGTRRKNSTWPQKRKQSMCPFKSAKVCKGTSTKKGGMQALD